jgi:hypothetical protein
MTTYYGTGTAASGGTSPWLTTAAFVAERVVKATGHYDLVVDAPGGDYSDNGLYYYMNKAQRWLDLRAGDFDLKRIELFTISTSSGSAYLELDGLRIVETVWTESSDLELEELEECTIEELREKELDETSTETPGTPAYYALLPVGLERASGATNSSELSGQYNGGASIDCYPFTGILLFPYADYTTRLRVKGRFFSPVLTASTQITYWTTVHPGLLVDATIREVVTEFENESEIRLWTNKVEEQIFELTRSFVQAEKGWEVQWRRG